jgi:hypothetical protein
MEIGLPSFARWEAGETTYTYFRKSETLEGDPIMRQLPVQYARLILQFESEEILAQKNPGHEAQRRQVYVRRMLDELALELERDGECGSNFRSKVLTPVLQRQIHGIPDTYAPSARSALVNAQGPGHDHGRHNVLP